MSTLEPGAEAGPSVGSRRRARRSRRGRGRVARVELGELVSALSALLLLICIFALAWFGTVRPPGRQTGADLQSSEDGWSGLTDVRWVLLLTVLVALAAVIVHVRQAGHGAKTETGALVALCGLVSGLLLTWRVLVDLPQASQVVDAKLGAYLGLLCAWGIAVGGWRTNVCERGLRRRAARGAGAVRSAPG